MQQASVVLQHQIGLLPPSGTPPGKQGSTQSPPDAHQLGLPFGADYEHGGRMLKPRIKRALEVVRKAFKQLAFPLFDFASPGNTTRLRGDDAVQPALGEEPEDLTLPKPAWSSDEVARLHGVLLEESLKALKRKGNAAEKRDVLKWIFAPPVTWVRMEQNGVWETRYIRTDATPFSFAFCCRLENHNPDVYRDAILARLRGQGIDVDRRLLAEYAMAEE